MPASRPPGIQLPEQVATPPGATPAQPRPHSDRGQGRPPFSPSPAQRSTVTLLRGAGLAPLEIAQQLGVSRATVYKHFRLELDYGKQTVVARIGAKLVQKAMKGDNACMFFYLRAHGGPAWNAPQKHEHAGPDGSPLQAPNLIVSFLKPKTEDEEVGEDTC